MAPSYWVALPVDFFDAPRITLLAGEFGITGPCAFLVILTATGGQGYHGGTKGHVRLGWVGLARTLGIEATAAQTIVGRIAELGLIEIHAEDVAGFKATLPDWDKWLPHGAKDPKAAERKRREREKKAAPGA
jgi:hypothetical protein